MFLQQELLDNPCAAGKELGQPPRRDFIAGQVQKFVVCQVVIAHGSPSITTLTLAK
jgi:hypothetical protein